MMDKIDVFTIGFICGALVVGFVVWLLAVAWAPVNMEGDTHWDPPPNTLPEHRQGGKEKEPPPPPIPQRSIRGL